MASFVKGLELDKEDLRGKVVALKEVSGGDGNFCLSCIMWQCLSKPDNGLLLLAAHHTFNHYYHVGMKLGYNLMSQKKRAVVLELGKALSGETKDELFSEELNDGKEVGLQTLFLGLKQKVCELKTLYSHIYVILDNLSSFLFLGYNLQQTTTLFRYLRTLVGSDVTLVVSMQTAEEDDEETQLAAFLRQAADVRMTVSPLKTGSSQEVSGSIEISKRDHSVIECYTKPMLYHYKLSERNVRIFLPGNI